MQGTTSKTVVTVYGTRAEAIAMAPLIHALEGHPWLNAVVLTTDRDRDGLDEVHDVFAVEPDVAVPTSGSAALSSFVERLTSLGPAAIISARSTVGDVAAVPHLPNRVPVACLGRDSTITDLSHAADLHLVACESAARSLIEAGVSEDTICIVGDPAADALAELVARAPGLPDDVGAAMFADDADWSTHQRHEYARESFVSALLVDADLRSMLTNSESPFTDGRAAERCIAALEDLLRSTEATLDGSRDPVAA